MMALKSCASAEAASCSAVRAEGERKLQHIILLSNCSTLALSRARVNPHHCREAYIKDETVVVLATSWMAEGGRPCERRTLIAYMEKCNNSSLTDSQVAWWVIANPLRFDLSVKGSYPM